MIKRKQYRKYKIKVTEEKRDGTYYALIFTPMGEFLTSTLCRNDEPSIIAQAEEIIDEDIKRA